MPCQLPPPIAPGNVTTSCPTFHGVYGTASCNLYLSQMPSQNAASSGWMFFGSSERFNAMRASGGGFSGNGCVGDDFSPGAVLCGTGRSSHPDKRAPAAADKSQQDR